MDRLPEDETGVSFNGISPERSARSAAELFDFGMDLTQQKILCLAILMSGESTATVEKRRQGFNEYFEDLNKEDVIVNDMITLDGTEEDQLNSILEDKTIKGIFVLNSRSFRISSIVKNDVMLIGYDLFPENLKHLQSGVIKYLINSQSGSQSFDGIMKLSRLLTRQENKININYYPTTFVSLENLEDTLESQNKDE